MVLFISDSPLPSVFPSIRSLELHHGNVDCLTDTNYIMCKYFIFMVFPVLLYFSTKDTCIH